MLHVTTHDGPRRSCSAHRCFELQDNTPPRWSPSAPPPAASSGRVVRTLSPAHVTRAGTMAGHLRGRATERRASSSRIKLPRLHHVRVLLCVGVRQHAQVSNRQSPRSPSWLAMLLVATCVVASIHSPLEQCTLTGRRGSPSSEAPPQLKWADISRPARREQARGRSGCAFLHQSPRPMYTAHATHTHRPSRAAGRPRRVVGGEIERYTVGERRADVVEAPGVTCAAPEHPYVLTLSASPTHSRVDVPQDLLGASGAPPTAKSSDPSL